MPTGNGSTTLPIGALLLMAEVDKRKPSRRRSGGMAEAALPADCAGGAPNADGAQSSMFEAEPASHTGHRKRLRDRFLADGGQAMPDYELLELVLFKAFTRKDTKDLAKRLIARFGSFAEVVNAPAQRLKEVKEVGDAVVTELKLVRAAALRLVKSEVISRPALSSWPQVLDYIRAAQAHQHREVFRILFLDKKNRLIADEVQGEGTVDHTPVYVREVVKRALELSSTTIILVHNHPSGDPTPSKADIDMTRLIVDAGRPLGVTVHDHIIVGREGHVSLRSKRLI